MQSWEKAQGRAEKHLSIAMIDTMQQQNFACMSCLCLLVFFLYSSLYVYMYLQGEVSLSFVLCHVHPGVSLVLHTNPLHLEMLQRVFLLE